jgi:hypothetical protein
VAHFCRLDENNIVQQVIVVDNKDTSDANGLEKEHIGAAFCERLFGGTWKQTSYNANFRKNYAGIGYTYDEQRDAFIPPQRYAGWLLNEQSCQWEPPVPMPTDGQMYSWNEDNQAWDVVSG